MCSKFNIECSEAQREYALGLILLDIAPVLTESTQNRNTDNNLVQYTVAIQGKQNGRSLRGDSCFLFGGG